MKDLQKSEKSRTSESHHERPKILLRAGELPEAIDNAEDALVSRYEEFGIFQRAGELVRVVSLPKRNEDRALKRPKGTVQLEVLSNTALTEVFNRVARWRRANDGSPVRMDCPPRIAALYLTRNGQWRLPVLSGIISAPILRQDGSLLERAGYDPITQLYLASDQGSPEVPKRPTRAEAETALKALREPFKEFPFVDDADRSVHIACILTAIQRPLLGACPLFGYSAPSQRSGKSLLAECVAIIATGKPAAATAISGEREETRKMITSTLREAHPIVNLDNVEHPLASPDLAKAITQPEYQDRALGANRMLRLPTTVLWTATGNNLSFRGDLASRAIVSRIDARMESPEVRNFRIPHLREHILRNRGCLIAAGLTILRAYHVAGCPRQHIEPWGGFEHWSRSIREPLIWLGMADPCATRFSVIADDPDREQSSAFLQTLHDEFEEDEFTMKRIIRHCKHSSGLKAAVDTLGVMHNDKIDPRKLGWWLRKNHDRIIASLRLESAGKESGVRRWRVKKVGHSGHGGQNRVTGARRFQGPGNTLAKDGTIIRFPRLPKEEAKRIRK